MTISERIKIKREELGMTQEELAFKCGYKSRSSINKIELARDLPLKKVSVIAKALNVSPGYIMGWEDNLTSENADEIVRMLGASYDEMDVINRLRKLSDDDKEIISNMINALLKKREH